MEQSSPAKELENFLNFIDQCVQEYKAAYENVNEEDRRLQDLVHAMEFAADKSERNRVATKFQQSRKCRRQNKDIVKRNERIVKFFEEQKNRDTLNRMRQLLGQQRKEEEYLDGERVYKPRVGKGRELMNQETAERIAKEAALEAVKEFKKSERKEKRVKIFQNTKKLMENYNRICRSVQEGISDLSDMDDSDELEGFTEEDIFINSILKSKLRSVVMIAHIDKCLSLLEEEEYSKNTPEKYLAFKYYYLDGMTYENIAEVYGYVDRTARRWVTELTNILSVYLFGSDAIMLD